MKAFVADKIKEKMDGWSNVLSGMGRTMDKRTHTTFSQTTYFSKEELAELYGGDGLVKRIIDTLADDMTREWISIPDDRDGIIVNELERLNAVSKINTAIKWARLFGGSLLFIGALDRQSLQKPLNVKRIKNIEYLKVFDLGDINTYECVFDDDPRSNMYGEIIEYDVFVRVGNNIERQKIHYTRVIPFYGVKVPSSIKTGHNILEKRYWGDSVISSIWDYLRDYVSSFASVCDILFEFIIGKYKFADLDEMLAQGNENLLHTRMEAIEMTKSILHSVLLGTDEDYVRDSASLAGIAETLDRFMMNLCAVTEYPVTKLFGRSPAGLNATGENDLKNYYDAVRSKQISMLSPCVQYLIDIIAAWKNINPSPRHEWNSLFQLTEAEISNKKRIDAETYRTQADADQRYMAEGVLTPEEVYKMRFEETMGERDFTEIPEEEPDGPDFPEK
mgnify:CR=1 FL=1